jgi:aspartyl/asparaginyl beta-hydroxylase (cupin superfamily)
MNDRVKSLVQSAGQAAAQGRWEQAEQLWQQVRALDPGNAAALHSLGMHAFRRGDRAEAEGLLQAAHRAAPAEPMILLSLAHVLRERGDEAGEQRAIDASLVADAYFLPGLLARGNLYERRGRPKLAAEQFRNALKIAPPEAAWPPALRPQLEHARQAVEANARRLADFLAERTGAALARLDPVEAQRFREAGAIISGHAKPYRSECNRLYVPRLPAIPFFERRDFEWVDALESRTGEITAELQGLLAERHDDFRPYVECAPGAPVNQWRELNHSTRWSSYFLWRDGAPVEAHQQRCPRTTAALREVEMADIGGLCPNAMFSALAPHTHIPPHHGETNARLVVHLPLVVPPGCRYRVGFEHRTWTVGEVLVFDDSIEHEARNDGDELRVVLIFDVWNPLLSAAERDMVRALSAATREYQGQP